MQGINVGLQSAGGKADTRFDTFDGHRYRKDAFNDTDPCCTEPEDAVFRLTFPEVGGTTRR